MDTVTVVPVAKDESSIQSQNALEDLFADVEFQASYPPISATASNSVSTMWTESVENHSLIALIYNILYLFVGDFTELVGILFCRY